MKHTGILHILLTLLPAIYLCSCSEDIASGSGVYGEEALSFSASSAWGIETPHSRATETDNIGKTSFANGDAISVTAAYGADTDTEASTIAPNFMYALPVVYDGSAWEYSPTRYWPTEGKLHFYAHYPYDNSNIALSSASKTGKPTLTFTQPATADIDLLAAETSEDCANHSEKVKLTMRHVLAKVNFLFSNATSSSLSIKGIAFTTPSSGTFSYTYDDSGLPQWTANTSNTQTVAKTLSTAAEIATNTENQAIADLTSFILPGTLTSITLTMGNGTTKTYTPSITIAAGKEYNLRFSAGSSDVEVLSNDANCYILNPPATGEKTFEIPIKRINTFWGNNGYENVPANTLDEMSTPWTADILWSEYADNTAAEDTITLAKAAGNGYATGFQVRVKAGLQANVLVAVRNSAGTVLWSWHLWITDYDPKTEIANGRTVMDRNIGAFASADTYDNAYKGVLYYQYGRKDPFPYKLIKDKQYPYTTAAVETVSGQTGTDMAYAVNHPITFITEKTEKAGSTNKSAGWWTVGNNYNPSTQTDIVWQDPNAHYKKGLKSLFDPSPYGWKIPEGYVFDQYMTYKEYNSNAQAATFTIAATSSTSEFTTYFPFYNSLNSKEGKFGNDSEGYYWSSWVSKEEDVSKANYAKARYMELQKSEAPNNTTNNRCRGTTIRCMVDAAL